MNEGGILTRADLEQIRNYPIDPMDNPIFFKMSERYVELWEHWQAGCRDGPLVKELTALGELLPFERKEISHPEAIIELLRRMQESGYSRSEIAYTNEDLHARKQGHRGMSRTAESAILSIHAAELAFQGYTNNEIADRLCNDSMQHNPHRDLKGKDADGNRVRIEPNKCGENFRKRVYVIKKYFRDYGWKITDVSGTNFL